MAFFRFFGEYARVCRKPPIILSISKCLNLYVYFLLIKFFFQNEKNYIDVLAPQMALLPDYHWL